jgi:predicted ATPase
MDSIRIQRLRSLSDTGDIQIKPITILLGQNSSGKSTLLRVLPLLKQSVESRTTGPILWYGRLVDFGSFDDAHQNGSENTISLSFNFCIQPHDDDRFFHFMESQYSFPYGLIDSFRVLHNLNVNLILEITESKKKEITRTSRITLLFEDSKIQIDFNEDENVSAFYVNSLNILELGNQNGFKKLGNRAFLPLINEVEQKKDSDLEIAAFYSKNIKTRYRSFRTLLGLLQSQIKKNVHHSTTPDTITKILLSLGIGNSEAMLKDIQTNRYAGISWKKKMDNWSVETEDFKYLKNLVIANATSFLIERCDDILANFSRQISYMGPVRATAERYYRTQDLAVDEVDYQGRNLAMFLRNLKESEMTSFSEWTLENFGFKPLIKSSLGHISLKIRPKNSDRELNIADTGFGFSQILPIITQLWLLSVFPKRNSATVNRRIGKEPITYAIEQPELHLHPRLQGIMTDAFVTSIKKAKEKGIDLRLVIETHSEALVNRLGHLVAEGKIDPEQINIILFESSDSSGKVEIRKAYFDADGYLSNWPLGFFEMEN